MGSHVDQFPASCASHHANRHPRTGVTLMFEAARFGDEISHTGALGGFLIGAVLGIALIATVAIATFTCGFG
ncbi:hypothetical protein ALO70_05192, partial [Pseudomonas amygdali pv. eriobotryae]